MNTSDCSVYLTQQNVTGKWFFENTFTNQIHLIELYHNNTWNTIQNGSQTISGKWNLYNDTNKINTNVVSKMSGKNIWISVVPKQYNSHITNDIMFIGKITQLGKTYLSSKKVAVSSRINGSVVYCFGMDPEISENFYMKRWFQET